MEEKLEVEDILILDNELIFNTETGGENAIELEADVLLLTNALAPEPVVKKIDVGPRISRFELREPGAGSDRAIIPGKSVGWNIIEPNKTDIAKISGQSPAPIYGEARSTDLAKLLAEARAFATDYGLMNARTRKALYAALGRTYDLTFYADSQSEVYLRLVEEAGLTIRDRAPYTPVIKLVFGADYDKTRIAEFAAAMAYGRRQNLPAGSFSEFLDSFEGGLKAMVSLERLMRQGDDQIGTARNEARPALASKLRRMSLQNWYDLPPEGDEFALLLARRLPDGRIAMVGEVPRDIALLEKAARKLLANLGRTDDVQTA